MEGIRKALHNGRQQLRRLQRESKRRWGKATSMLQEVPCFVREGAEGPWRMCQALEDLVKKERRTQRRMAECEERMRKLQLENEKEKRLREEMRRLREEAALEERRQEEARDLMDTFEEVDRAARELDQTTSSRRATESMISAVRARTGRRQRREPLDLVRQVKVFDREGGRKRKVIRVVMPPPPVQGGGCDASETRG